MAPDKHEQANSPTGAGGGISREVTPGWCDSHSKGRSCSQATRERADVLYLTELHYFEGKCSGNLSLRAKTFSSSLCLSAKQNERIVMIIKN